MTEPKTKAKSKTSGLSPSTTKTQELQEADLREEPSRKKTSWMSPNTKARELQEAELREEPSRKSVDTT